MYEQMKMMKNIITILCTQLIREPTNPMKLQITMMIENLEYKVLEDKVETCSQQ